MAYKLLLSALTDRCKERSDKENDEHISDAEWRALISEQYGELYQLVVATGMRYFESTQAIAANGAASYALPSDHLSTIAVRFVQDAAGRRRELREVMQQETTMFNGLTGEAHAFALSGETIILYPTPASGSYEHVYVPQTPLPASAASNTLVDLINIDGLSFLIWGVTLKALAKSQHDVTLALREREAARERLELWATLRMLNEPRRRAYLGDMDFDPGGWWNR